MQWVSGLFVSINSSTGALSATFSTPMQTSFTVRVTDSGGTVATKELSLTIVPALQINLTGAYLPAAAATVRYTTRLTASGGTPPYTFSAYGVFVIGVTKPSTRLVSAYRLSDCIQSDRITRE